MSYTFHVGEHAEIHGLTRRSDLNAEAVEILEWKRKSNRWAVRVLSSAEDICVRTENLRTLASIGGPAASIRGSFSVGQHVTMHGLERRCDLNGEEAEILEWRPVSKRWAVRALSSNESVCIRTENLSALASAFGENLGMSFEWRTGQHAVIQGLKRRCDLNGEEVEILEWRQDSTRWAVRVLGSNESICTRAENLRVLASVEHNSSHPSTTRKESLQMISPRLEQIVTDLSFAKVALEAQVGLGRRMIAITAIDAGDVIFEEAPFLQISVPESMAESMALAQKVWTDPYRRDLIMQLSDWAGRRSNFYDRLTKSVVDSHFCPDAGWGERWTRIWNVNAFTYQRRFCALFLAGSMFNHSCAPNAMYQTIAGKRPAIFRACQKIDVGDEITLDYTTCFEPTTHARQRQLREEKLFDCRCSQCSLPDRTRGMTCPTVGCNGSAVPDPPHVAPELRKWRCESCDQLRHDKDMPLAAEAWIGALVIDHENRHSLYTHEHFVGTMSVAAELMGPRHWTVHIMVELLIESLQEKAVRAVPTMADQLIALTRVYIAWARDVHPPKKLSTKFANRLYALVRALQQAGLRVPAASLAKECITIYRTVWGRDDPDTAFLATVAEALPSTSFMDGFQWDSFWSEIKLTLVTDSNGNPSHRSQQTRDELRGACIKRCDPLETMMLGRGSFGAFGMPFCHGFEDDLNDDGTSDLDLDDTHDSDSGSFS